MIAGIDVGSHKVVTLIGEALPGGGARVRGIGHAATQGIRGGEVEHIEEAAGSIATSLERAERLAADTFDRALVGISGAHVASTNNRASVPFARRARTILAADVERSLDAAGTVPMPIDREVLHVLPRSFHVDAGQGVRSPVGMSGCVLAADAHLVTVGAAPLATLRRCLELADVDRYRFVLSTLAAAEAVLTRDERQLGVALVDLGHATTGVASYREGSLAHTAAVPIGGRHMTHDLAVFLQASLDQAERIKKTHGHVLPEHDDGATTVEVVPFGADAPRPVSRHDVSQVLAARADELADLVATELGADGVDGRPPAGVVLVGGGAELRGLARRLHLRWQLPVRIGRPRDVAGLATATAGPDHAAAVGLLLWSALAMPDAANPTGRPLAEANGHGGVIDWLRTTLLPRRART